MKMKDVISALVVKKDNKIKDNIKMKKFLVLILMVLGLIIYWNNNVFANDNFPLTKSCVGPYDGDYLHDNYKQLINEFYKNDSMLCTPEEGTELTTYENLVLVRLVVAWIFDGLATVDDKSIIETFNCPIDKVAPVKQYLATESYQMKLAINIINQQIRKNPYSWQRMKKFNQTKQLWEKTFKSHPRYKKIVKI